MNPGLRYLLGASWRGFFRRTGRRMRTARGFASTVLGVFFFVAVVGSQLLLRAETGAGGGAVTALTVSLVMMLLLIPSLVAADAPFFWPQEVQFLFPAPLTRGELLLYQMLRSGGLQAFSGLWVGVMAMGAAGHPLGAVAAGVLGLIFIFTLTQLAGLVKLAAGDRMPPAARAASRPVLGLLGAAAVWFLYRRTQAVGFAAARDEAFASAWIQAFTLPARPFGELFAAGSWSQGLLWGSICIALVVGTGAAAMASAVDFRERSLVSSARRFERLRRMRASRTGYASAVAPKRRRVAVPALAFLGPAAPLARRQVYELGRGLRTLWGLFFTSGLAFFYVVIMPRMMALGPERQAAGITLVMLVIVFPLLASGTFSIDFRRDVERMAYLRSLPLPPRAVAVGQVFTAAALIALVNLALLGVTAALAEAPVERGLMLAAAGAAVPVAWLAVTLENWLFLLFPTRTQADGGQQNAFVGKQIVKLLFKMVVLGLVALVAVVAAALGDWLAGAWGAAAGVAGIALLACAGATALLARAFRRFDLTVDSPA